MDVDEAPAADERRPIPRWLALLAVLALVASGAFCAHSILTDSADFGRVDRERPRAVLSGSTAPTGG